MITTCPLRRLSAVTALVFGAAFGTAALAVGPTCGDPEDDSWMPPEAVQARIETLGYTIENLSVSEGNCYEISGRNVQGASVTTYLDPRTGDIVQEDIVR